MRFLVHLAIAVLLTTTVDGLRQNGNALPESAVRPKTLVMEIRETDSGVGGTNQFVFLRIFSDRTVELHSKRSQDIKKNRVTDGEISQGQLDTILTLLAREDVKSLPSTFRSTYTPIDFNWTLDMKIPRGAGGQQIKLVNFYPEMAKQNNKPYPEALLRLACTVLALRQSLNADTPYSEERCRNFVSE
jgi:hypothetical protein